MTAIQDVHIRKLDIGMLWALYMLLEKKSISGVAREIGLSQPALSHSLGKMREIFNDPLLIREGNQLVLTPCAVSLRDKLEDLMPSVQNLFDPLEFDPSTSKQNLKIAITDHAGQVLLPEVLRRLAKLAPEMETTISIIPNRQTDLADLDEGRFDTRVGWLKTLPANWRKRKLCDERIVLVCAPDNEQLAKKTGKLSPKEFVDLRHVALDSDRPIYPNIVDSLLAKQGLKRKVVARVSHFAIVPYIIANSDLCAIFPERLAQTYADQGLVKVVDLAMEFPDSEISMAWHPRVHYDPAHMWLRKVIVETTKDMLAAR